MARATANIKRRHWKLMFRSPASFTTPADLTAYNTLLGTMTEFGICESKTIKLEFTDGDTIEMDTGKDKLLSSNGLLEARGIQSAIADYTALLAIDNVAQDYLLVDHAGEQAIFVGAADARINESVVGGEIEGLTLRYEAKNVVDKDDFRTRFAIPTS